jgi:predicted chitinase
VTGNQLTFFDPEAGRTDLTGSLKANMKVVGYNLPENTTIISIDSGTQITISNNVREYGENIIEFANQPSNLSAIAESKNPTTGVASTDQEEAVKPTATNTTIPTVPPPKSVTQSSKASEGIKALIAACDKVGLTTKEQKCALLGIAGGESGWIPTLEGYNYSPARMKQIYSFATDEDVAKYAQAEKKGLTRSEFFSWAYGPTKRGKNFLGNTTDEEGGKYFGRGFIQLTGKANYVKYNKLAKAAGVDIDIVTDPDSLDKDINVSALVAALYIKDRVAKGVNPNAHPGYFYAAKQAVGVNSPDISAKKLTYYEYFYGIASTGGVVKDAGAVSPGEPVISNTSNPGPSDKSIQSGSFGVGFRDPNNKYPLKDYIGESDVNRLARGVIDGTVVGLKDAKRVQGIPKAMGMGQWDQPLAAFGAKYPFNKVYETESGHVQEFDDTPGQERTHLYHRTGTFTEVDANGSQVNYIVGDNFVLMEQNGCIHVKGECNITVGGTTNIYAQSDANIQVEGNAAVQVGNNLEIGVASDTTLAVGGDLQIKAVGDISMEGANIYHKTAGSFNTQADEMINMKTAGAMNQEVTGEMNIKTATMKQYTSGKMDVKAGGVLNVDYATYNLGTGAASTAGGASDAPAVELTPPELGSPLNPAVPYSIPPERQFEEKTSIETPDDWDTPEGRAAAAVIARGEGQKDAPPPVADESNIIQSGGATSTSKADCALIYTTKDFTNDYRLSKNFSLGMLIAGGVNGKHRLTAQMLTAYKGAPERLYTIQEIVCNLAQTAHNVLEPALDVLPGGIGGYGTQWTITSGYRLKGVVPNESPTSDHCKGHCVDLQIKHPDIYNKTYDIIQKLERVVAYDQCILEYRFPSSVWMHFGYRTDNNRKQAFTMVNDKTYRRNDKGIPAGFFLLNTIPPKST